MSENKPRNEGGRFGEKATEQDVFEVFESADEPFLATAEVAPSLAGVVAERTAADRATAVSLDDLDVEFDDS